MWGAYLAVLLSSWAPSQQVPEAKGGSVLAFSAGPVVPLGKAGGSETSTGVAVAFRYGYEIPARAIGFIPEGLVDVQHWPVTPSVNAAADTFTLVRFVVGLRVEPAPPARWLPSGALHFGYMYGAFSGGRCDQVDADCVGISAGALSVDGELGLSYVVTNGFAVGIFARAGVGTAHASGWMSASVAMIVRP